ncbi:Gti1/Pac2 family-domain-containing protein [Syncephalis fuscata]|nr:Gti1/Pac2 family-domain-containing protein [Syncephalis fuscata]
METYFGYIDNVQDALLIIEAARNGSIFVWDESEAGMRRWTDGRAWSPSRVSGCFLNYRELEHRRRGPGVAMPYSWISQGYTPTITWVDVNTKRNAVSAAMAPTTNSTPVQFPTQASQRNRSWMSMDSGCTAKTGFRYKVDGLVKRTISVTVSENRKLHLISYFRKRDVVEGRLRSPRQDSALSGLAIPPELYPDVIMVPTPEDDDDDYPVSPTALRHSSPTHASEAKFTERMPSSIGLSTVASNPEAVVKHVGSPSPPISKLQHRRSESMMNFTSPASQPNAPYYHRVSQSYSPPQQQQHFAPHGNVFVPTPSASPDLTLYTSRLGDKHAMHRPDQPSPQPHGYGAYASRPVYTHRSSSSSSSISISSPVHASFFPKPSESPLTPSEQMKRLSIVSPINTLSTNCARNVNLPSLTGLIPHKAGDSPVTSPAPSSSSSPFTTSPPLPSRMRCDEDCRQLDAFRSRLSL